MSLIECPECRKSVSDAAKSCPSCGVSIRKTFLGKVLDKASAGGSAVKRTVVLRELSNQLSLEFEGFSRFTVTPSINVRWESEIPRLAGQYLMNESAPSAEQIINKIKSFNELPLFDHRIYTGSSNWLISRLIAGYLCKEHMFMFSDFWDKHRWKVSFNALGDEEVESIKLIYHLTLNTYWGTVADVISQNWSSIFADWKHYVDPKNNLPTSTNKTFYEMCFASLMFEGEEEGLDFRKEYWGYMEEVNPALFDRVNTLF